MPTLSSRRRLAPSLSFALSAAMLTVLLVSGGASRADALGQVLSRGAAWALLIAAILFMDATGAVDRRQVRSVTYLLAGTVGLAVLQLVPLPPALWQALPGRALLSEAARVSGQDQPWRPLSIVPGATVNALSSLIVPVATLVLVTGLSKAERWQLPGLLLSLIVVSTLVGLLQFSGAGFDNPLVNDTPGEVSGFFANRNHFALFTAIGCLLAPVWAFREGRRPHWRGPIVLALVPVFILTILGSGSRAGIVVGMTGSVLGFLVVYRYVKAELDRYPRWVFPALVIAFVGVIAFLVLLTVAADRAVSIDRALAVDPGQDMRSRGLPTVIAMVGAYMPWGSGLGGFDPVFRIHEPFSLLKPTYFNHAHNDFLEIVLDAGLFGLLLLLLALMWWVRSTVRAWRARSSTALILPRLGSAVLLLVILASAFDYPARTPMIMSMMVIAGIWLSGVKADGMSALPHG